MSEWTCRALREEMYRANITRASSGEKDNSPIIEKVLSLKQEKAHLLGYDNFAEVSMASKVSFAPFSCTCTAKSLVP
jgi:oligopeptidase A